MKTLEYRFTTTVEFSGPVREHVFVLRCLPYRQPGISVISEHVEVGPDAISSRQRDSLGNELVVGSIRKPHDRISYVSEGVVRVGATIAQPGSQGAQDCFHPLYKYPSELARANETMLEWAHGAGCTFEEFLEFGDSSQPNTTDETNAKLLTFERLGTTVHHFMAYEPGATSVSTTAAEAFDARSGVCQDFAHIMIAILRAHGIPARYVSGLAVGQGTTHAWAQAFIDGAWHGYDPTRDTRVDDTYLPLAVGRDWSDCPIERGSFWGLVDQTQTVFMTMSERLE